MGNVSQLHLTSNFHPFSRASRFLNASRFNLLYLLVIAALYLASYESESPENHVEKDRWKTLRFVSKVTHINK